MSNDVAKKQPLELDSIDGFDDTIAGGDGDGRGGGGFLPDGMRIKFTRTERWEDNNGNDITGKGVLHLDTIRMEVRWGKDGMPVGPPRCSTASTRTHCATTVGLTMKLVGKPDAGNRHVRFAFSVPVNNTGTWRR
jgi:hypothetical protein